MTEPRRPPTEAGDIADAALPLDSKPPKNKGGRPKGSGKKDSTPRAPRPAPGRAQLREGIKGFYQVGGAGIAMVHGPAGMSMLTQADEIADAWLEACDAYPGVKSFWEKATATSTVTKLVAAHAPIALAVFSGGKGGGLLSMFGGGGTPGGAARPSSSTPPPPPPRPTPPPPPPPPAADDVGDLGNGAAFNPAFADTVPASVG